MSWRVAGSLALVSWGALSFGAVYPWGAVPLYAGSALFGAVALVTGRSEDRRIWSLAAALALVVLAVGAQLVPLRVSTIERLSPHTIWLLTRYDVYFAATGAQAPHPLSISPNDTMLALAAFVSFGLLICGSARALSRHEVRTLCGGVVILGLVLALIAFIQKATSNGRIYGFWVPIEGRDPFGPFVNRNHFAGWMLLCLPMAVGYFCGRIVRGTRTAKSGWRNQVVWWASAEASRTLLAGFSIVVMAIALVLTFSRSGIAGFILAMIVSAYYVVRRQTRRTRLLTVVYLAGVVGIAIGWVGLDPVVSRFMSQDMFDMNGRIGAWIDAWNIVRRFPLTGTGLNTYGVATLFYQTADLVHHYSTAHNDYLQLAAEGGLLVCAPALLAIGLLVDGISRRLRDASPESPDYWIRAGCATGLLAVGLQEIGDFSLQIPGNAVLFCLLAGIALRTPSASPAASRSRATVASPASVAC